MNKNDFVILPRQCEGGVIVMRSYRRAAAASGSALDQLQFRGDLDLGVQAAIHAAVPGVEAHDSIDLAAVGFGAHGQAITNVHAAQHRRIVAAFHLSGHRRGQPRSVHLASLQRTAESSGQSPTGGGDEVVDGGANHFSRSRLASHLVGVVGEHFTVAQLRREAAFPSGNTDFWPVDPGHVLSKSNFQNIFLLMSLS